MFIVSFWTFFFADFDFISFESDTLGAIVLDFKNTV